MADAPRPPVAPTAMAPAEADPRPTTDILRSAFENFQALVKAEIDLAKAEVTEILVARLLAVASFAVVAVLGLFILGFAGVTLAKALEQVVVPWVAWLITTGVFVLVAVVLALLGLRLLKRPPTKPVRTIESLEQTRDWAQQRFTR